MNLTVVEFISTPGAGKTTLLPTVKNFFAARGMRAWPLLEAARPFARRTPLGRLVGTYAPSSLRGPLLWQVFHYSSRLRQAAFHRENRELMDSLLRFQHERPISRADRGHVLRWFLNLTGQYQFFKEYAQPNDVLILDEGFVHRVVQLFASESENPLEIRIRSYLNLIPLPSLVIHPQASLETCLQRVHRRGLWERFQGRGDEAVAQFMGHAHTIVNLAVGHAIAKGWPVIQVDNEDGSPQDAARRLEQDLASLYAPIAEQVSIPINA